MFNELRVAGIVGGCVGGGIKDREKRGNRGRLRIESIFATLNFQEHSVVYAFRLNGVCGLLTLF